MKHPKFNEKSRGSKRIKKIDEMDYTTVDQYINNNRIESARSKYPGYSRSQIADVMREVVNDVKMDLEKDGHTWNKLYAKRVTRFAQNTVVEGAEII